MQWEKVLTGGLGDPKNDRVYFRPFYMGGRIGNRHRYYRLLYISAWGPASTGARFVRASAEMPQSRADWQDAFHEILAVSYSWEHAAVGLSDDIETNRPLEPQQIGPIALVYKGSFPFLGEDLRQMHDYYDLYVCANSPLYYHGGAPAGDATLVYKGALAPFEFNHVEWSLEAVLPGQVTDPAIIGFNGHIFVSLEDAAIGTNASGVWGKTGEMIQNENPENMAISSFYSSSDTLYAGTWGNRRVNKGAEIWRSTDGLTWEREWQFEDPTEWGITSMTEFGGQLYVGTMNHQTGTHIWRRDSAGGWTDVTPAWDPAIIQPWPPRKTSVLRSYGDTLYAGGGQPPLIFTSKEGVTWAFDTTILQAHSDVRPIIIMDLVRLDARTQPSGPPVLFAGVGNPLTGIELWRSPVEEGP